MAHATHTHPIGATGRELDRLAFSATLHCLTGCVAGEVVGMFVARALGWAPVPSIALAVGLAFLFGYALTSRPLLRAGLSVGAVVPIALATDTVSIAIMETVDNAVVLAVGGMEMGPGDPLLWLAIAGGFAVAFPFAFLANRALLRRGKGHAHVHAHHAH